MQGAGVNARLVSVFRPRVTRMGLQNEIFIFLEIKLGPLKTFHQRIGIMVTKLTLILGINIQLERTFLSHQG